MLLNFIFYFYYCFPHPFPPFLGIVCHYFSLARSLTNSLALCCPQAVNIRQLVLVLLTYKSFPRLTFLYMYTLQYYNMFLPVIQSQMQDNPDNVVQEAPHAGGRETDNSEGLIPEPGHVCLSFTLRTICWFSKPVLLLQVLIEPSSKQLVAITLEILLLPHLVIAMFALSYFYYNKFVFSLVLVHCIHSTVKDVRMLRKRLRNEVVRDRSNIK